MKKLLVLLVIVALFLAAFMIPAVMTAARASSNDTMLAPAALSEMQIQTTLDANYLNYHGRPICLSVALANVTFIDITMVSTTSLYLAPVAYLKTGEEKLTDSVFSQRQEQRSDVHNTNRLTNTLMFATVLQDSNITGKNIGTVLRL